MRSPRRPVATDPICAAIFVGVFVIPALLHSVAVVLS